MLFNSEIITSVNSCCYSNSYIRVWYIKHTFHFDWHTKEIKTGWNVNGSFVIERNIKYTAYKSACRHLIIFHNS